MPENHLSRLYPDRLSIRATATVRDRLGKKRPLTPDILRRRLAQAPRQEDGSYRMIASKFLSGKPLGPFRYYGTRPDDGNDLFPHEARRELRGLRIFAAWLNHDDSRNINSLDMSVRPGEWQEPLSSLRTDPHPRCQPLADWISRFGICKLTI